VKLRLHGTRQEVAEATCRLGQVLDVVAVSPPSPDRGTSVLVRIYLQVRLPLAPDGGQEGRDGPATTLDVGEVGG
jgi:hypothetical protein